MAVVDSHFITAVYQMELSGLVIEVIQFMCPLLWMKLLYLMPHIFVDVILQPHKEEYDGTAVALYST